MLTQDKVGQPKSMKVRAHRKFYLVKRVEEGDGGSALEHTITVPGQIYALETSLAMELIGSRKAARVDSPEDVEFMTTFEPAKAEKTTTTEKTKVT